MRPLTFFGGTPGWVNTSAYPAAGTAALNVASAAALSSAAVNAAPTISVIRREDAADNIRFNASEHEG